MRPLRVAQVCLDPGIAPGGTKGASRHLSGVATGLARGGHEVVTFTSRAPRGPFPNPVHRVTPGDLAAALRGGRFDVVYERYALGRQEGLEAARGLGLPHVLEVNAPLVDEARRHRPDTVPVGAEAIERRLLRDSDVVVVVSSELGRWVEQVAGRAALVVPNGVDPSEFGTPGLRRGRRLGFLGHPKPWHGYEMLVPVLGHLVAEGHDVELVVIGGGRGTDEIAAMAREWDVSRRVTITGPLAPADALRELAYIDVGLAPYSPSGAFYFCPLKVLEYMSAGIPVVAGRRGDIPALMGPASGILVDAHDSRRYADAVATLLDNSWLRLEAGRQARRRALGRFTWERAAQQIVAAIELPERAA